MEKIYLIQESIGDFNGSSTTTIRAFKNKKDAFNYVDKFRRFQDKAMEFVSDSRKQYSQNSGKPYFTPEMSFLSSIIFKYQRFDVIDYSVVEIDLY